MYVINKYREHSILFQNSRQFVLETKVNIISVMLYRPYNRLEVKKWAKIISELL
jgi:hypothetical protein